MGGLKILNLEGKKAKEMEMPKFFSEKIRADLIAKVIESKKGPQPYAPSLTAGKKYSASGKLHRRRHVWKNSYGRGISRVPRKIMTRKGSQFSWQGATAPHTKGGIRAHPPKIEHWNKERKVNKRELKMAFISALSASAQENLIFKRYSTLNEEKMENLPFVVESGISKLKTKELIECIKKIIGENIFKVAIIQKSIRAGAGRSRGRKYKSNSGLLLVVGNKELIKTGAFEVAEAKNLSVNDLAKGGLGRIIVYTEDAIRDIERRLNGGDEK